MPQEVQKKLTVTRTAEETISIDKAQLEALLSSVFGWAKSRDLTNLSNEYLASQYISERMTILNEGDTRYIGGL